MTGFAFQLDGSHSLDAAGLFGDLDKEFTGLDANAILGGDALVAAGAGTEAAESVFGLADGDKEFDSADNADLLVGAVADASHGHKGIGISRLQIPGATRDIAPVARWDEVRGIVVGVIAVEMVSHDDIAFGTTANSENSPLQPSSTPMTLVRAGSDLGVEVDAADEHGAGLRGQGVVWQVDVFSRLPFDLAHSVTPIGTVNTNSFGGDQSC